MDDPAPHQVLVINAGSSSLKYQLIDLETDLTLAGGLIERIGEPSGPFRHVVHAGPGAGRHTGEGRFADHEAAFAAMIGAFEDYGPPLVESALLTIGHRVVHGGRQFTAPSVIDDEVEMAIRDLIPLAPLHNPANLTGIQVALARFPQLTQVAVFDTSFHTTMPESASTYAVPAVWREKHGVHRYGFHGTSHAFVARRTAALLGRAPAEVRVIVLHLGNGASVCAVDGGRSVNTSMGLSPLAGLVMGTRSGDVDPAVTGHLARVAGLTAAQVDAALNKQSGLLGLTGSSDFREVTTKRAAGDPDAALAFDVAVHRIVEYIGAYAASLGGLDAVAFTGGIGENSAELRAAVLDRLAGFGLRLDAAANDSGPAERAITAADSSIPVFVVATNEELEIAQQAAAIVRALATPPPA